MLTAIPGYIQNTKELWHSMSFKCWLKVVAIWEVVAVVLLRGCYWCGLHQWDAGRVWCSGPPTIEPPSAISTEVFTRASRAHCHTHAVSAHWAYPSAQGARGFWGIASMCAAPLKPPAFHVEGQASPHLTGGFWGVTRICEAHACVQYLRNLQPICWRGRLCIGGDPSCWPPALDGTNSSDITGLWSVFLMMHLYLKWWRS